MSPDPSSYNTLLRRSKKRPIVACLSLISFLAIAAYFSINRLSVSGKFVGYLPPLGNHAHEQTFAKLGSSRVPLLLGAASFGELGTFATRIHDLKECQRALDIFILEFGYREIDVARKYGNGTSEEYLSKLDVHGARIDTKCPRDNHGHSTDNLRACLSYSLNALKPKRIRTFFLHAPDETTLLEETLEEVNRLYKQKKFEAFGLSNFSPFGIELVHDICQERGYILPSVYQDSYSLLDKEVEKETIPLLRRLNIRFLAFSPLAGGLLAGNLKSKSDPGIAGGRFDNTTFLGQTYRNIFTSGKEFEIIDSLTKVATPFGITLKEIAFRWLQHHSQLLPNTDGVLIGFSSVDQLRSNIEDCEKGPLPTQILDAIKSLRTLL